MNTKCLNENILNIKQQSSTGKGRLSCRLFISMETKLKIVRIVLREDSGLNWRVDAIIGNLFKYCEDISE